MATISQEEYDKWLESQPSDYTKEKLNADTLNRMAEGVKNKSKKQAPKAPASLAWLYIDGEIYYNDSHWKIVDKLYSGDLAEWLYDSQKKPMMAGWIYETGEKAADGRDEAIIDTFTEFAPHKQPTSQERARILNDVMKEFEKTVMVVDIEEVDLPEGMGITERFTPEGVEQSRKYPIEYKMHDYRQYEETPAGNAGQGSAAFEITNFQHTRVEDADVTTYDMTKFPNAGFLTVVDGGFLDGYTVDSETSDKALHAHHETVKMLEDINEGNRQADELDKSWEDQVHLDDPLSEYPEHWGVTHPSPDVPGTFSWDAEAGEWNKIAKSISPDQLTLFDAPGLGVIPVDPPEGSSHYDNEKPFLYYRKGDVLFETTDYCHHGDVWPGIIQWVQDQTGEYPDISPGQWVNGDITSVEATGRNWIKFIDSGPLPKSVVEYFKAKYPDREVMYSSEDGWQPAPKSIIAKFAGHEDEMSNGAFGFIGGQLVRGNIHHQGIIAELMNNGWTWEELFTEPQAWGWFCLSPTSYEEKAQGYDHKLMLRFTSDAATQWPEAIEAAKEKFKELYQVPLANYWTGQISEDLGQVKEVKQERGYGSGLSGMDNINKYLMDGEHGEGQYVDHVKSVIKDPIPTPPHARTKEYVQPPRPDWLPEGLEMVPTGLKTAAVRDMEEVYPAIYEYNDLEFCFGYLELTDTLYLGKAHHASIIAELINGGITWEQLFSSRQLWGWADVDVAYKEEEGGEEENEDWGRSWYAEGTVDRVTNVNISFSTDEAKQTQTGIKQKFTKALKEAFPGATLNIGWTRMYQPGQGVGYGDRARTQYLDEEPIGEVDTYGGW